MPIPVIPWKDHETDYCRSLVMAAGTREVPDVSVLSYLDTQIASARKDGAADAREYIEALRRYWLQSPRYLATHDARATETGLDDEAALNIIQCELNGNEWSADTLDRVAAIVRRTTREVRDSDEGSAS
jgi:hypothetical protein